MTAEKKFQRDVSFLIVLILAVGAGAALTRPANKTNATVERPTELVKRKPVNEGFYEGPYWAGNVPEERRLLAESML
ncbi:MAG: hypothetical protein ACYC1U_04685 [Candidatus Aquicultorales bacterium]